MLVMLLELVLVENRVLTLFSGTWVEIFHLSLEKEQVELLLVIGIAPIFFNTAEDSGCLPIQAQLLN